MNIIIKIIQPHNSETLLLDHVRPGFVFYWDAKLEAYTYHPKNQEEIDSIFAAQRIYKNLWAFIPHLIDGPATESKALPPDVEAKRVEALEANLAAVLAERDAALKRIDQLNEGMVKLKAECDATVAKAIEAIKAAPALPPAKVKGKPGRKPKTSPFATNSPVSVASSDSLPAEDSDDLPTD